jgi:hypothetical protein
VIRPLNHFVVVDESYGRWAHHSESKPEQSESVLKDRGYSVDSEWIASREKRINDITADLTSERLSVR